MNEATLHTLTVYYDNRCGFCAFCRHWLSEQPTLLHLEFRALHEVDFSKEAPGFEELTRSGDLVVRDNLGGVYHGPDAFIMVLFATRDYRDWSQSLSSPTLKPLAKAFFRKLSSNRKLISRFFPNPESREHCETGDCALSNDEEQSWIRGQSGCAKNCSFCLDCLDESESLKCTQCGTRVHRSCLEEMRQCPTLGCGPRAYTGRHRETRSVGTLGVGVAAATIWALLLSQSPFLEQTKYWSPERFDGHELLLYAMPIFAVPLFFKALLAAFNELSDRYPRAMVDDPQGA